MNRMMVQHTKHSLCLIDEFGKGTSPLDGMSLLAAIIRQFATQNGPFKNCRVFFALHFHEVINEQVLGGQEVMDRIHCLCMATHKLPIENFGGEEEDLSDHITPLYRLKLGISRDSDGIGCASLAGIESSILRRALEIRHCIETNQPFQRRCLLS